MKIVKQNWMFEGIPDWTEMLVLIESAGRVCYKTEQGDTIEKVKAFVKKMIDSGHHSVIEHGNISVRIITDRGVTHELVRHRLASYSQESTRYCNYSKDKFGNEITVILPVWFYDLPNEWHSYQTIPGGFTLGDAQTREKQYYDWKIAMARCEESYFMLLDDGQIAQEARSVLPNSLKTEIVMTANVREWRHVFTLRCSPKAHPQIRELMLDMLRGFKSHVPVIFDDIYNMYCCDKDR